MYACLSHGFLGVRDVLAISGPDLTPLFQIHQAILFDTWWTPYLVYQAFRIARGWKRAVTSGFPEGSEKNWNENFTTVGRFLLDHPIPPWISMSDSWWSEIIVIFKPDYSSSPQTVDLAEPAKYLGIAVSILIAAELALDHRLPQGHNPPLGAFSDLYPYILRRWEIDHNARLGNLPVPASFQNLFTEWADRKIDFVNHSDNPQPARVRQALQHSHRRQKHGQGPPRTF
jgi:hypothetical protein